MSPPPPPIRAVFFDAAGTLFTVTKPVSEIYLQVATAYGFRARPDSAQALKSAFQRAMQDAPPPVFLVDDQAEIKRCERLWWFDVVHNVFYRVGMFDRFDDFFDEVFRRFDGPEFWRLYPDTLGTLDQLRARGLELGIVSNFDSRLFTVLRSLDLADRFDTVTISSLARAAKPAPAIFRLALDKHALDPDEVLHVGDHLREDVEGAEKAGLTGVWIDRSGDWDRADQSATTSPIRITSLNEIPALLERRG